MSIMPNEFLIFAENVLKNNTEICNRNAISRAYYAFYHSACDSLRHCPPTSHSGVISYLRSPTQNSKEKFDEVKMRQIAALLEQMKQQRQIADYDLSTNIEHIDASTVISTVKKGILLLN